MITYACFGTVHRYVVKHIRVFHWTNICHCGQDRYETQCRGMGCANAKHDEADVSDTPGCFCTCQLPHLETYFQAGFGSRELLLCLHLRNAGCPSLRTGHLALTASSRSMHRRPCGVTVCTNLRSDPAARGPLRGRVLGCMGMIGGKSGGDAGMSRRRLVIEHPRASPLHITLCSSTILAVAVPRPTVC